MHLDKKKEENIAVSFSAVEVNGLRDRFIGGCPLWGT